MSEFEEIISVHCVRLYNLCQFSVNKENRNVVINRRFLGMLNLESTWMEETLDAAGARNSDKWFPFREGVSAIKMLSNVAYDVLHVSKRFKTYKLLKENNTFEKDIDNLLDDLYFGIVKTSNYLIKRAKSCGMQKKSNYIDPDTFIDFDSEIQLVNDRKIRHITNPGKSLIYLATEFINLKPEMTIFNNLTALKKVEYKDFIPDSISEEKLRLILVRFHNLQSLYDTYLSESDIESADNRLKILRGHISFIYHMLKSATDFTHYYERHIVPRTTSLFFSSLLPISVDRFLEITIDFFMYYFIQYFEGAIELCRDVIDSYAEIGEVSVLAPAYRGFHVRPSSLISKIINYYGGSVKMVFNGVEYDPSSPLELFRVNEEINAMKRIKLFDLVHNNNLDLADIKSLIKKLSLSGDVVIYDEFFECNNISESETLPEYLKNTFAYLIAAGKIDIKMDIYVKFIGDMRSLLDIELLANNGYGEDKYGNNITLPKKLLYLRR